MPIFSHAVSRSLATRISHMRQPCAEKGGPDMQRGSTELHLTRGWSPIKVHSCPRHPGGLGDGLILLDRCAVHYRIHHAHLECLIADSSRLPASFSSFSFWWKENPVSSRALPTRPPTTALGDLISSARLLPFAFLTSMYTLLDHKNTRQGHRFQPSWRVTGLSGVIMAHADWRNLNQVLAGNQRSTQASSKRQDLLSAHTPKLTGF
jgi:hypothetical protein